MTSPIKFPSARQPVTYVDANGQETFTRPWFLFFQAVYERVGGAVGSSTTDLAESLFEDAGVSESNAGVFELDKALQQKPLMTDALVIETLFAELAAQRDALAEVQKELDAIKQGQLI